MKPMKGSTAEAGHMLRHDSRLALFDHLPRKALSRNFELIEADRILHPATIKLGGLYSRGIIFADDDRVTSLIAAFCNIIQDYKTPPKKILREDLDRYISKQVNHLVECRQISRGMGNLIKYLRFSVSKISPEMNEAEAKAVLMGKLQSFLEDRVIYAAESISNYFTSTLRDSQKDEEVILTFGSSPLVRKVLLAAASKQHFRLVIVDARPLNDGLATLTALSHEVHCVYSPLSGAATAMKDQKVTRVLLGASALLSNGAMLGPAGTAMIAALAKARQIPVIVVAESYKFCDKVQLDSIVYNELGATSEIAVMLSAAEAVALAGITDSTVTGSSSTAPSYLPVAQKQSRYRGAADSISSGSSGAGFSNSSHRASISVSDSSSGNVGGTAGSSSHNNNSVDPVTVPIDWHNCFPSVLSPPPQQQQMPFHIVNLRYDLTPIGNISVVATETGLIPPTSIPVLMRELLQSEQPSSIQQQQHYQHKQQSIHTASGTNTPKIIGGSSSGIACNNNSSSGSVVFTSSYLNGGSIILDGATTVAINESCNSNRFHSGSM